MKKVIIILLSTLFLILYQTPSNAMTIPIKTTFSQNAIEESRSYIGVRYCRGGQSPRCFDCSGFTKYIYSKIGVNIPRLAGSQLKSMKRITKDEAKPGDLVFFSTKSGYIYHVGIYAGDGKMIHSPKPGRRVTVAPVFRGAIYATVNSVPTS